MNFPAGSQIGMIAQELEKEFPELVMTDQDGYKSIAYDRFTAVLLQAIKFQSDRMNSQQKQMEAQQKDIAALKQEVDEKSTKITVLSKALEVLQGNQKELEKTINALPKS
jgi:septal ring factor EnvC (AmiA/AmiB activator)